MYCNLLLLYASNHRGEKIIDQLQQWLKSYDIKQRLLAPVPIAVSSDTAAANMYR